MTHRTLLAPFLAALVGVGFVVSAPAARADEAAKYTAEELQTLVGPVALYPDIVLGTLLPATAFPDDIVAAADYVAKQGGKVAGPPEGTAWDANAQALLQYPDLLKWLKDNPDWVKQMGFAMSGQQSDVLAAVQTFRKAADEAGNLKSNEQQTVSTEEVPGSDTEVIVIEPTNPEVVYVPTYSPTAVMTPGYTGWAWGAGLAVGITAGAIYRNNNVNWSGNGGSINVNNNVNVNRSASATNVNRGAAGAAGAAGANRAGAGATAAGAAGAKGAANVGPNRPSAWQPPKGGAARPAGAPTAAPKVGGAGAGAGAGGAGRPGGTTGPAPGAGKPGGAGAGGAARPSGGSGAAKPSHVASGASDGNKARAQSQRGNSSMSGGSSGRSSGGGGGRSSGGGGGGSRGGGGGGGGRRR